MMDWELLAVGVLGLLLTAVLAGVSVSLGWSWLCLMPLVALFVPAALTIAFAAGWWKG